MLLKTCTNNDGLLSYVNNSLSVNSIENNCNVTNWECLPVEILIHMKIHNVYNKQ